MTLALLRNVVLTHVAQRLTPPPRTCPDVATVGAAFSFEAERRTSSEDALPRHEARRMTLLPEVESLDMRLVGRAWPCTLNDESRRFVI